MSREEDRKFKSADIWRIYCNHLDEWQQIQFRMQWEETQGSCDPSIHPCEEMEEYLNEGQKIVNEFQEVTNRFARISDELQGGIDDVLDSISDFTDALMGDLERERVERKEQRATELDELLTKLHPDPIERATMVSQINEMIDAVTLGAFAKTGKFAKELLKKQGQWGKRGELVIKTKEELDLVTKAALALAGFMGGVYKTFVEDCVDELRRLG